MPVTVAAGTRADSLGRRRRWASLASSDVWIIGYRDREQSLIDGMLMPEDLDPPIACLTTDEVRCRRPRSGGARAARALAIWARGTRGFTSISTSWTPRSSSPMTPRCPTGWTGTS